MNVTTQMHSIVFESVHKIFRRGGFFFPRKRVETHALRGISLEISPGEVVALLGPNGSGKSTTLKLVSTMLLPDRGKVLVAGCDTHATPQRVRREVGFALATERSFFPRLTVAENLEFFAAFENVPRRDRREQVNSVLETVDLANAAGKQAMKLSSGMYQRMGIARALLKLPSILLLDEPTRSVDPAAATHLWEHVRTLSREGITILLATPGLYVVRGSWGHCCFTKMARLSFGTGGSHSIVTLGCDRSFPLTQTLLA